MGGGDNLRAPEFAPKNSTMPSLLHVKLSPLKLKCHFEKMQISVPKGFLREVQRI